MAGKTYIQWKGTDLCMDLHCPECGEHAHFDGMFAYTIRCPHCKTYFKMPSDVSNLLKNLGKEKPVDPTLFIDGDRP